VALLLIQSRGVGQWAISSTILQALLDVTGDAAKAAGTGPWQYCVRRDANVEEDELEK